MAVAALPPLRAHDDIEAVHDVAGVHVGKGQPEAAGCIEGPHFPVDLLGLKRLEEAVEDIFDQGEISTVAGARRLAPAAGVSGVGLGTGGRGRTRTLSPPAHTADVEHPAETYGRWSAK